LSIPASFRTQLSHWNRYFSRKTEVVVRRAFGKISWIISTPVQPGARQAVRPVSEENPEALIGDFLLD
jgi:hypothetical protein